MKLSKYMRTKETFITIFRLPTHILLVNCFNLHWDMTFAYAFTPLIRNQETKLIKVYLDRMVADIDHRQTRPFDDIAFYPRWLTLRSGMMYPHLPECVIRQFGYMKFVPTDPSHSPPSTMVHKDVDVMCDGYLNLLVAYNTRGARTPSNWSCAYGFVLWYFRVLHPCMTLDDLGGPGRPTHKEILENKKARGDNFCWCVV